MGSDEREALRAAILARHRSIYAYCKATGVTKSVVLQLLAGRYPGNVARQTARIRAALADTPPAGPGAEPPSLTAVYAALERVGCARCRRTDKRRCKTCRALWERQAAEVAALYAAAAISHIA
ncbi:hypothetical protein [Solidesulfovibrio sp.]|uniref:hypothetical protein n=1 Tax=Solidesulfovibrio sp. TaxID=2910990 RepID=UPI00261794BD|nr:hypothetical protein [Solidesulfovibrio sp.]